ncbi:MAG TPA: redoxin domain-containing protein [Globicatella sulfidifaciens]|uniref:Redoxin domain-containing protein n=1 Tax=Globicatella sulfidifaciens TaxID=136093 RepID=A0A7X8C335_9LACT|nr:redoxin family protein [Globicatella sulfidifaciens]MDT2768910.1 redoxin domain-containing protein [Globicatella sulfidifaciens]NLJ17933.1 redoxin domain-containing protein [Globicatella sulfidifaciens]HJF17027.1 redoxin domain-containing protein [Globicatella sulfidifaciens]
MEIKVNGEPLVIEGKQVEVGDLAPNATLVNRKGETVQLKDLLADKVTILSVVPNILTRTCELQTKRLSDETKSGDIQYLTVSRNTPQEFNTWNQENELDVDTLTDESGEFGRAYGLDINLDGNDLLARTVYVIDQNGVIQYREIVEELTEEPTYKQPLQVAKDALK